jgi:hypothetical protein
MTGNRDLADRARQLADGAPNGSAGRKAYGCAAVVLGQTRSVTAARKVLASECPGEIRDAALAALDQIAAEETTP